MINFVLCEDHQPTLDRLVKMLESIFISNSIDAQIGFKSNNAEDILSYIKNNHTDVVILDIGLKSNISGIDLGRAIREKNKSVYIIYTTGHLEYVLLAYKIKTFDYLAKPIIQDRLEETILRLMDDITCDTRKKYIKIGSSNTFVSQEDINYIKRDGMKLVFHTANRKYETYSSFNKIKNCLPESFIQCHKSYYVNINNIADIKSNLNTVLFKNEDKCYIGPKYKNIFMEVMSEYGSTKDNLDRTSHRKQFTPY